MRIGKLLKVMRATENLGVREQAQKIGIPFPTLNRIENGHDVSPRHVARLIAFLFEKEEKAA